MKKLLSVFLALILFIFSCTKETTCKPDTVRPEIKVMYPSDDPIIPTGFALCMQVMISDNISLSRVWMEVSDGTGYKKEYEIPGRMMSVTEKYIPAAGTKGQVVARFFAQDEGGNSSIAEIKFTVNN